MRAPTIVRFPPPVATCQYVLIDHLPIEVVCTPKDKQGIVSRQVEVDEIGKLINRN